MRRGFTLVELSVVLAIGGLVAALAIPPLARALDGLSTHGAIEEAEAACTLARHTALERAAFATVAFDTLAGTVTVVAAGDTVARRTLGARYAVSLDASRPAITYAPNGLGYGAANVRVIAARGRAADTLWISRLGRVRH